MALQVFTANRLSDGVVVFLSGDERWLEAPDATGVIDASAMETKMIAVAEAAAVAEGLEQVAHLPPFLRRH